MSQPTQASPSHDRTNRLIHATSPYLLQHAHNPVDWYEWGPEALERARREDKPIFLSIGYAACHWCHVMAHESFEDPQIAAIMNRLFVNIKVDREERPDIDDQYMQATMIMNQGGGGWPMSVWLTPDLKPFYAGTYFPPEPRWGRPGFGELCEQIGALWKNRRDAIREGADQLADLVRQSLSTAASRPAELSLGTIDQTVASLARAFDARKGGMSGGGTNKFPPSMTLDLFLRAAERLGRESPQARELLPLVETTLDHMAQGGIYDQLAGGFHRYSTDPDWLVPHFEKMLYDEALVSRAYVDAWQVLRKPLYRRIACETFDYVIADLQSPQGGFYSTRDADSEGEEGRYYVWTRDEVLRLLGPVDGPRACAYFDIRQGGNWQDPHAPGAPKNILHTPRALEAVARDEGVEPAELERSINRARRVLLDARAQRAAPALDDKILCEWNGLMISSLARGGASFGEPRYIAAAARAADYLLREQRRDGRLLRTARGDQRGRHAFLTDYACLIEGLLDLHEATLERRWLDEAIALNRLAIELFHDAESGGFYFTAAGHEELLARSKDLRDGATPSGNSVQIMNLLRLKTLLADEQLGNIAQQTIAHLASKVAEAPHAYERFLTGVEFAQSGPIELAVIGGLSDERTTALLRVIRETYLPNRVLLHADPSGAQARLNSPLLRGRELVNGAPAVYVCRGYACRQPVTTPEALRAELEQR